MAKTVGIAEFKAKCIAIIKETRRARRGVVITLRGQPIARLEPIEATTAKKELGRLRDSVTIRGDIVAFDFGDEWEMEQ